MRLGKYLEQTGQTQQAFAQKVGLTQGRISQIIRGGTNDATTARAIERATDGAVTIAELIPPEPVAMCPRCGEETAGRTACVRSDCELFPATADAAA